jgi:prephenate dehydrogenase
MGLLGASITSAILRSLSHAKSVGFSHRASTRKKASQFGVASEIVDTMTDCVCDADIVILATPICTFEHLFKEMAADLRPGTIVTDVGSTKTLPHKWAQKHLPSGVHYVGSHPIAGSEKRGVEFARDDLLFGAKCIVTKTPKTNLSAVRKVKKLWSDLGCFVKVMTPAEHDRTFAAVSHVPHITAAALVNATGDDQMKFAGTGFMDTSRIASGPENIWADILTTNSPNCVRGIDRVIKQLEKLKAAIAAKDEKKIVKLLGDARSKRADLIKHKMKSKELL